MIFISVIRSFYAPSGAFSYVSDQIEKLDFCSIVRCVSNR